jgi:hypothetical protein
MWKTAVLVLSGALIGAVVATTTLNHASADPPPAWDRDVTRELVRAEEGQHKALEELVRVQHDQARALQDIARQLERCQR